MPLPGRNQSSIAARRQLRAIPAERLGYGADLGKLAGITLRHCRLQSIRDRFELMFEPLCNLKARITDASQIRYGLCRPCAQEESHGKAQAEDEYGGDRNRPDLLLESHVGEHGSATVATGLPLLSRLPTSATTGPEMNSYAY
jgi:hypothetical protein